MGHSRILILGILFSGLACRASRYSSDVKEVIPDSDFVSNCERVDLRSEAGKTYKVLMSLGFSSTCAEAERYLNKKTLLVLDERELKDISPLMYLEHIEWLHLQNNQIQDISSLGRLKKLRGLELNRNFVNDIDSLRLLVNLEELNLSHNRIEKIDSLGSLKELFVLNLSSNNIQNLNPLKSLSKLRVLELANNPILANKSPKNCPTNDEANFLLRDLCR